MIRVIILLASAVFADERVPATFPLEHALRFETFQSPIATYAMQNDSAWIDWDYKGNCSELADTGSLALCILIKERQQRERDSLVVKP